MGPPPAQPALTGPMPTPGAAMPSASASAALLEGDNCQGDLGCVAVALGPMCFHHTSRKATNLGCWGTHFE